MGMKVNAELPLPADLKNEYPLSEKIKEIEAKRDAEIRDIFTGKSIPYSPYFFSKHGILFIE